MSVFHTLQNAVHVSLVLSGIAMVLSRMVAQSVAALNRSKVSRTRLWFGHGSALC
jgi:hypothetical protein